MLRNHGALNPRVLETVNRFHSLNWSAAVSSVSEDKILNCVDPFRSLFAGLTHSLVHQANLRNGKPILKRYRASFTTNMLRLSFWGIAGIDSLHYSLGDKARCLNGQEMARSLNYKVFATSWEYLTAAMKAGVGWLLSSENIVKIVPIDRLRFDQRFRLHSENGPAVVWPNGMSEFHWQGIRCPKRAIMSPRSYSVKEILAIRNVEVRRIVLEQIGIEQLISSRDAEVLDESVDDAGIRKLVKIIFRDDEPYVAVLVNCPSTGRKYLLRVPPSIKTISEGIGWTFGFGNAGEYLPQVEA
jgi:hypothetical protein